MAVTLDMMEYANDAAAQAAYVSSHGAQSNLNLWSKLEVVGDVTSPQLGTGGSVAGTVSYPACHFGNGILSDVTGEYALFPRAANSISIAKGTIECWVKLNFAPTDADGHVFWTFLPAGAGFTGIQLDFQAPDDKIHILVYENGTTKINIALVWSWTSGDIAHFGVTWDNTGSDIGASKTLAVYIDNVEKTSSTTTWGATGTQGADLIVGEARELTGAHSDAVIDNLKTYNVCKTDFSDKDVETGYALECYSEDTIKEQGSYSLKGIGEITSSLNQTLTRTIGAPIDLSGQNFAMFHIWASRTGTNLQLRLRDSGGVWSSYDIAIFSANTWELKELNLSAILATNRDAIDRIEIKVINADVDNTFYIDNMYGEIGIILAESFGLLESLPTIERQLLAFEEAIALKDVSSVPSSPDGVFEEAIALKDVSNVPAYADIILQEALALKESLTEISRALLLTEAIALKESLPVINRQLPPLEEAIAFIESLPVIHREPPPLEEALALAVSFVASEQTIVRKLATAAFLAEQAKRSNTPAKRIWLYINSTLYDITDKFMSMGPIDRKMTYKPGETKLLTISDQDLVMSNADKYFSDLNADSLFYDRDYAGADQIKVYAGFIIPSTGYAEVLQKADMKLIALELMTKEAHAHLRCQDSFREVFDIYVGMPAADGTPNPLTYTAKTFKFIMDDLLINKAGIASAKVDIEDVTLTFSSISFEKKKVKECVEKLSEVARGNTVVLGDGTVQFHRFISEPTSVDLIMRAGENYSRLRYVGQDFRIKVNKVVVIGAAGVYAEAEISGDTGITLKYENDAILTDAVAADVAAECLGRFAVHPALVEVTGEYLPSLDLKSIVKVYEPNSMMNPKIFQIRELALDIVGHSTRMLLSIPDAAGRSKVWTSESQFDGGSLDQLYTPGDEVQLESGKLSGDGVWDLDAGSSKTADWIYFNKSEEDV